jgi:Xaa-Pro dipeptidase
VLCRYHSGRRHLAEREQLTLEFAGVERHYHACLMRTLPIGEADPRHAALWEIAREALLATEATLRPGATLGEAFDTHARVLDAAGHRAHRLNACGYGLGATFAPNWMDWPMLYHANPEVVRPGMVFFVHIIIFDDVTGLAMTLGRTSEITEHGARSLSKAPI